MYIVSNWLIGNSRPFYIVAVQQKFMDGNFVL
jgi:hypothetical protein